MKSSVWFRFRFLGSTRLVFRMLGVLGVLGILTAQAWAGSTSVIVLAAGLGSRMKSDIPKVLHELEGKPMLFHILSQIKKVSPDAPVAVVVGYKKELVETFVRNEPELRGMDISFIFQEQQKGTGHATRVAMDSGWGKERVKQKSSVLVFPGDLPLVTDQLFTRVTVPLPEGAAFRLLTTRLERPTGYGRIARHPLSQNVVKIVEEKDATLEEKSINEVGVSTYLFDSEFLSENLKALNTQNKQGEYYLTDLVEFATQQGKKIDVLIWPNSAELLNVNNPAELAEARELMRLRRAQ